MLIIQRFRCDGWHGADDQTDHHRSYAETDHFLLVFFPGRAFGIEVKTAKGKQRDAQKKWQEAWEKRGGIYILARSVEDVYRGLDIPMQHDVYKVQHQ